MLMDQIKIEGCKKYNTNNQWRIKRKIEEGTLRAVLLRFFIDLGYYWYKSELINEIQEAIYK